MAITEREKRRLKFVAMLEEGELTSAQAAELLHSSVSRIGSWRKAADAAGSNPVPMWAMELLALKLVIRAGSTVAKTVWAHAEKYLK